ncbi:putative signal peptide protein [Puccinia sorghi]|uniref:Putative signal peptide protein n=1 Tax=Puccinia sorghi TaxID=27349 RepID=A0A0L6V4K3_9BASI|nr:putative signal peptide protein [Puccinia sorghi]
MWSLDGSLAGACCMSTAGSCTSFVCIYGKVQQADVIVL